jgi:hypothetical protein
MSTPTLTLPEHLRNRATLRPRDFKDVWGISRSKVHALILAGKLDALKLDGLCMVTRESVERWLASAVAK